MLRAYKLDTHRYNTHKNSQRNKFRETTQRISNDKTIS